LEAAAWKRDAGTAIACDPDITRFYVTYALRAADRGWLRLHFLTSGATRVAFDYSLQYRNRMFLLKVGYEPAFAPYSPSNLLLARVLENAFEQGLDRYDFLGENADWKQCWANQSTPNYWLFVFAGTAKGRCLHFLKFRLTPLMKRKSLRHVRNFAAADGWRNLGPPDLAFGGESVKIRITNGNVDVQIAAGRGLAAGRGAENAQPTDALGRRVGRSCQRRNHGVEQRQADADAGGAAIAGSPDGLASALRKIDVAAHAMPLDANPATAHLFIIKPFSGAGLMSLFSTHPPTEARIEALRRLTRA
jgi:hypothetical protein